MPVDFGLETMNQFIDWNRNVPFEVIRGEGECAVVRDELDQPRHGLAADGGRAPRPSARVLLCSFQKEESVLIDELLRVSDGRPTRCGS